MAPFDRRILLVLHSINGTILYHFGDRDRFCIPPAFEAPLRGPRRSVAIIFGMGKLEWCGYPTVKKV